MKRLSVLLMLIVAAGISSCKKDTCEKEKTPYELLTMDDWRLFKKKTVANGTSFSEDLNKRCVFTPGNRYYYFDANDTNFSESGNYELNEGTMELTMDKDFGAPMTFKVATINETEMELNYESGPVTYVYYYKRN